MHQKRKSRELLKKTFLVIFLFMIIPNIHGLIRIYLIGKEVPSFNAIAIDAQWKYIDIFLEIISEAFILPLVFFIGNGKDKHKKSAYIKTTIIFLLTLHILFAFFISIFINEFIVTINTPPEIVESSKEYLLYRIWTTPLVSLSSVLFLSLVMMGKTKRLWLLLFIKTLFMIFFDVIFISKFLLNFGVKGVVIGIVVGSLIELIYSTIFIKRDNNISFADIARARGIKWKRYFKVTGYSGLETTVRNIFYIVMVLSILNSLGPNQVGGYNLTMTIFWQLALVPALAFSDALKYVTAKSKASVTDNIKIYIVAYTLFILPWSLIIIFYSDIVWGFTNNGEVAKYSIQAASILGVFYYLFAINNGMDGIFYGLGKTKYQAIQAIATNVIVYVVPFILWQENIWIPDFNSVLWLFSAGLVVDTIITSGLFIYEYKRLKKKTQVIG